MKKHYRQLTKEEIKTLESNGCRAEDWSQISVADKFTPQHIHCTRFYGNIALGVFEKNIPVGEGFSRHSGISNATLHNVNIGNNSLIENIGNHINNYDIGEECHICNCGTIETTGMATFGQGNVISVLNEAGSGNVVISDKLTSNIAALSVSHPEDSKLFEAIKKITGNDAQAHLPANGKIGNKVKITNTTEIINTIIADNSEICGAYKIYECSLTGCGETGIFIGAGVICKKSVITNGSSIYNNVTLENCFVGEACSIKNGFSAENSVFFANTYMSNGEACAAFCGPFTTSHHKSSLLIGTMLSFYNAGSATNFSNHAYKMGPIHHGTLERGTKTASGAHILLPARIGAFSMCMGKITCHPDTANLPFSYIIAENGKTFIVPARNITTAGLFRDTRKWEKRDMRQDSGRPSIVNFDWLNPFCIMNILRGKEILERLLLSCDKNTKELSYNNCIIKHTALKKGIELYDMAIMLFLGSALTTRQANNGENIKTDYEWRDLSGLIIPAEKENEVIEDLKNGKIASPDQLQMRFKEFNGQYENYKHAYARLIAKKCYGIDTYNEKDMPMIKKMYHGAVNKWTGEIRKDAEKEFMTGDVERNVLEKFLKELEKERTMLTTFQ